MFIGMAAVAAAGERTLVAAKSDADYSALRADVVARGDRVIKEMRQIGLIVVETDAAGRSALAANAHAAGVAKDRIVRIVPDQAKGEFFGPATSNPLLAARLLGGAAPTAPVKVTSDPANALPGLMWNLSRVGAPAVWPITIGSAAVKVGVADTGLDFTHSELATKVTQVVDLTDPTLCATYFGASDADFAALYGGPVTTDWHGHGSWIGGNIAAALDGVGINGIAPGVSLVALKISEWCGSAYDSSILSAFLYAADHNIDIVSISFGGYLDRTDPAQETIYQQYVSAVAYGRTHGTLIVAAAGNEHARIGKGGRVLSHGTLTIPGDPVADNYGLYETPGGVPGVIDVSSTGNVVNGSSLSCPAGTTGSNATCKPATDPHQPTGVGRRDQLTYYSNYGPRIDVAGPGGARKFNVPNADRGGTGGFPYTIDDGTTAFEDFSITSNWALQIPCFFNLGPQFYPNECYSTIQGTSMATPHVSAVLALIASAHPELRHHPSDLARVMLRGARVGRGNTTPGLSATDTSAGDRTGLACPTGYCHLGGDAIEDEEAYGAGIVDARVLLEH
jgi:subtilisin family serine protease